MTFPARQFPLLPRQSLLTEVRPPKMPRMLGQTATSGYALQFLLEHWGARQGSPARAALDPRADSSALAGQERRCRNRPDFTGIRGCCRLLSKHRTGFRLVQGGGDLSSPPSQTLEPCGSRARRSHAPDAHRHTHQEELSRRWPANESLGPAQKGDHLLPLDSRKPFQKVIDRVARGEVFDKRVYRHARARKYRRSAENLRRYGDDAFFHTANITKRARSPQHCGSAATIPPAGRGDAMWDSRAWGRLPCVPPFLPRHQ